MGFHFSLFYSEMDTLLATHNGNGGDGGELDLGHDTNGSGGGGGSPAASVAAAQGIDAVHMENSKGLCIYFKSVLFSSRFFLINNFLMALSSSFNPLLKKKPTCLYLAYIPAIYKTSSSSLD